MDVPITDPLQGDFPEVIEEYLQHGIMKCIAFNRRGTLLAAGCADGSCVIWDFETRGVVKELRDIDCISPITSVCWSKYGHHILASATDKSLTLWDVATGEKVTRVTLQQTTLLARLHPGSCTPSVCLACPLSSAPMLVDLNSGSTNVLPVLVSNLGKGSASQPRNRFSDGSPPFTPTAATFNNHGDLIYVGNSKGEILIVDYETIRVLAIVPIPGGSVIKNIAFSRTGQYMLTNSNDRVIRVYENLLPKKGAAKELEAMSASDNEFQGTEKLKATGLKCLSLFREFQDAVTKIQWKAPCFSGDGEWMVGASASRGEHKIYIWDRAGPLVKILEGPKEALTDLAWHPVRPLVLSVSISGLVYIWAKDFTENWSAFAPDFKELEENEEYIEREDEFDLFPVREKVKDINVDEDEDVDVVTMENDLALSDSDASQEELCFLPAIPSPEVPEQEDKYPVSYSKVEESTQSGSVFTVEVAENGVEMLPASVPVEVIEDSTIDEAVVSSTKRKKVMDDSTAEEALAVTRSKRKRKPSAKILELQAARARKSMTKMKPYANYSRSKNRVDDEVETDGSTYEDDVYL